MRLAIFVFTSAINFWYMVLSSIGFGGRIRSHGFRSFTLSIVVLLRWVFFSILFIIDFVTLNFLKKNMIVVECSNIFSLSHWFITFIHFWQFLPGFLDQFIVHLFHGCFLSSFVGPLLLRKHCLRPCSYHFFQISILCIKGEDLL